MEVDLLLRSAGLVGPRDPGGPISAERHRLRMLAMLAAPVASEEGGPPSGPPLDLWGEWERLAEALGTPDAADGGAAPWAVGRLPSPTTAALADELAGEGGYQVLHLACHACSEGVFLEDRVGRETLVTTDNLVAALGGRGVRLAVLNACETEGVARALVEQGAVDAAIATREPIYDDEAKALTRRLYRRLAQGDPVGEALRAAREEIRRLAVDRRATRADASERAGNVVLVGNYQLTLEIEPPAADSPLLRRGLPPHNDPIPLGRLAGFVGRHEELFALMQWFEEPGNVAFALHGVGGIGKTTLALAAAVRQAHRFEALAFATAKDRSDFGAREVHYALTGALRLPPDPAAATDPEAAATRLLNTRRVLLILDNLETVGADGRRALGRILDGIEPAAGSRALLTLRPRQADPLTRHARDHRRLEALDEPSALRLVWELTATRPDFPAAPAADAVDDAEATRLKAIAARAYLRFLTVDWLATADRLAGLAFRHPKMIELAVALVAEHGWEAAEARLQRLAGKDVREALDELIGAMVDDLAEREPEALEVLHAALVFEGGARLDLLREVALGRRVDNEDDAAFEFADGQLRAARRANLLTGDGRFDLDPTVRAFLERFRPPTARRRSELELAHARALVPILSSIDSGLIRGEVSLNAVPEWSNLTAAWERLVASAEGDPGARDLLLEHASRWRNLLLNNYDPRREAWLSAALTAAQAAGDRLGEADALWAIGEVLRFRSQFNEALDHYQPALDAFRAEGNRLGEAKTLLAIGDVLQFRNQSDEALDHYQRALEAYRTVGDRLGEANTLKAIGDVLQFRNQSNEALDHYQRALEAYRTVGDRLGEANTLGAIGDLLQFRNQIDEALDHHQRALEAYRTVGDPLGEANTLRAIGDLLQFRNRLDVALDHYQRALEAYRAIGALFGEASCRAAEGQIALLRKNQAEADGLLAEAVAIYEEIGDRYSISGEIGNYGWALLDAGRPEEARPYLLRAAALFEEMGLADRAERCRRAADGGD